MRRPCRREGYGQRGNPAFYTGASHVLSCCHRSVERLGSRAVYQRESSATEVLSGGGSHAGLRAGRPAAPGRFLQTAPLGVEAGGDGRQTRQKASRGRCGAQTGGDPARHVAQRGVLPGLSPTRGPRRQVFRSWGGSGDDGGIAPPLRQPECVAHQPCSNLNDGRKTVCTPTAQQQG